MGMTSITQDLNRRISLLQATAINMTDMVGIGPFVVIYLVIQISCGPAFLYAWFMGAFLSLMDALIWSELGAAYPLAGGSYNFLKVAYGEHSWGRLLSFLYVWQTLIQAPLVMASAAIGFSEYLGFFIQLNEVEAKAISGSLVLLVIFLLYRKIEDVGRLSVILWSGVLIIFTWIIGAGLWHGQMLGPLRQINDGLILNQLFFVALGQASVKTIYSFLGYYNVCHLGGEIVNPSKNIPRSMLISVIGISILYVCMNLSVMSVIPWQEAMKNKFVVSEFIRAVSGPKAAAVATVIILFVAFASLFSTTLGYSRVPYAAARDKAFFPIFARVHKTKHFPYVSLLVLGFVGFIFSLLFRIHSAINGILAMRILVQFVAQAIGVVLIRKRSGTTHLPFKMPLYPLPVIVSVGIWLYIFVSTGVAALAALALIILGSIVFYFAKDYWAKLPG